MIFWAISTSLPTPNFRISGVPISHYPNLSKGLAMVKLAAARARRQT